MKTFAMATAALILAGPIGLASAAPLKRDFVEQAIRTDNAEIMLGNLASAHGGTEGVRHFGQMLVDDHIKARQQMAQVAGALSLAVPKEPPAQAQHEYKRLSALSGKGFDKPFLHYEIEAHKKAVQLFRTETGANQGKASQAAEVQLATLEKHLRAAEALQKQEFGAQASVQGAPASTAKKPDGSQSPAASQSKEKPAPKKSGG